MPSREGEFGGASRSESVFIPGAWTCVRFPGQGDVVWLIPVSIIHMDTPLILRAMLAILGRWNRAGLESLKTSHSFPVHSCWA